MALALLVTAGGLVWLTSPKTVAPPKAKPVIENAAPSAAIPYQLQLSSEAAAIEIDSGLSKATTARGTLQFDSGNPQISLVIRWKNPPAAGEQRFAKLTLEAPGKPTFTHVFDSTGDIDDLLELPLSP